MPTSVAGLERASTAFVWPLHGGSNLRFAAQMYSNNLRISDN